MNNYVQLFRLVSIVHSYVIYEGKASLHVNVTASITSQSREILTGCTKYQDIDGYFYDNVVYPGLVKASNQVTPSGGWAYLLVNIIKKATYM